MIEILKYPYPFKAWISISNDPDNTDIAAWRELNTFLFDEMKLPWANAVFPFSFNQNLPTQVNLSDYPEIAQQPTDTLHTWGDFVHAGSYGFSRNDAEAALGLLSKFDIKPKVWVDHSRFTGNLIHNKGWGATPQSVDSSGVSYKVFEYTLDLVWKAGIRYIWDGTVSSFVGQDRSLKLAEVLAPYSWPGKVKFVFNNSKSLFRLIKGIQDNNALYRKHQFPDGRMFYIFSRFGSWLKADIDGLAEIISAEVINELIDNEGAIIVYTHLGKKNGKRFDTVQSHHIPEETKACIRNIKSKMDAQVLKFSSVSYLLDYLVVRDHIQVKGNQINFVPDGIRFQSLNEVTLAGHAFSLRSDLKGLEVRVNGKPIAYSKILSHGNQCYTIQF